MIILVCVSMVLAIALGILIALSIINPMKQLSKVADSVAAGDVNITVDTNSGDEIGDLSRCMSQVVSTLRSLIAETGMLAQAAVEGKLEVRGNADKFQGGYKETVTVSMKLLMQSLDHLI